MQKPRWETGFRFAQQAFALQKERMRKFGLVIVGVGVVVAKVNGAELNSEVSKNIGQACFTLRENKWSILYSGTDCKHLQKNASNYLNTENSYFQSSETEENNSVSGWQRMKIYGIEFLATGIVSFGYLFCVSRVVGDTPAPEIVFPMVVIPGNTLLLPLTVCATGDLLGEKGSFWKAMLGAGIGAIICGVVPILPFVLPPLGAVIGYNL